MRVLAVMMLERPNPLQEEKNFLQSCCLPLDSQFLRFYVSRTVPAEIALSWIPAFAGPDLVHVFYKNFPSLTKVFQIRVKM